MRIISKFKDYYDGVQYVGGYSKDERCYVRETKLIENFDMSLLPPDFVKCYRAYGTNNKCFDLETRTLYSGFVIFCGKLIPFITTKNLIYHPSINTSQSYLCEQNIVKHYEIISKGRVYISDTEFPNYWCFDLQSVIDKTGLNGNRGGISLDSYDLNARQLLPPKKCMEQFFSYNGFDVNHINIKYESPIIVCVDRKCYINPILSEMNFQKYMDSYTTYQEIDMFIGNVLVNDNDKMIKLKDEDRLYKAGFDKYSFRKEKQK